MTTCKARNKPYKPLREGPLGTMADVLTHYVSTGPPRPTGTGNAVVAGVPWG